MVINVDSEVRERIVRYWREGLSTRGIAAQDDVPVKHARVQQIVAGLERSRIKSWHAANTAQGDGVLLVSSEGYDALMRRLRNVLDDDELDEQRRKV